MKSTCYVLFYVKKGVVRKDDKMSIVARMDVDDCLAQFKSKVEILPEQCSVKTSKTIEYDEI